CFCLRLRRCMLVCGSVLMTRQRSGREFMLACELSTGSVFLLFLGDNCSKTSAGVAPPCSSPRRLLKGPAMTMQQRPIPVRADPAALHASTIKSFARALIAYAVAEQTRGDTKAMEAVLRTRFGDDRLAPLILRAATSPLTVAQAGGLAQIDLIDDILVLV